MKRPPSQESREHPEQLRPGFEELQHQLEEWMQGLEQEQLFGLDLDELPDLGALPDLSRSKMQSLRTDENGTTRYELEVDVEGRVKAKVTRQPLDGEPSEEHFEADNMEAFRQAYPEVAQQFQTRQPRMFGAWPGLFGFEGQRRPQFPRPGFPSPDLRQRWPDFQELQGGQRSGRLLGVQVEVLEWDHPLRAHVALEEGLGLLVVSVNPGLLADKLGVRKHDILIRVAGHEVGEPADVRQALEGAELSRVSVTVMRQGREIELREQV